MSDSHSTLPAFKYHPDPLATGNVVASENECLSCESARGYVYAGPAYTVEEELDNAICPWCIADGSAAKRFDAEFTSISGKDAESVDPSVVDELLHRTPGFVSWQDAFWLFHCNDACEFRGDLPADRLATLNDAERASLLRELPTNWTWEWIAESYEPGGQPAIYWFVCRHCGANRYHTDYT